MFAEITIREMGSTRRTLIEGVGSYYASGIGLKQDGGGNCVHAEAHDRLRILLNTPFAAGSEAHLYRFREARR